MRTALGNTGFVTASKGGLWSILRTVEGQRIVTDLFNELSTEEFITASNDGLWSILRTEEGRRIVYTEVTNVIAFIIVKL